MTTNDTGAAAAESNPLRQAFEEPLTSIPQTLFGAPTLYEGRRKGFLADLHKLLSVVLEDYFDACKTAQLGTDELLWLSFKRTWCKL